MTVSLLRQVPLLTLGLGLAPLALTPQQSAQAAGDHNLINQFCLASFQAAMASAGQTAPDGMGSFTCQCFVDKVTTGTGLDTAQSECKNLAAERYKL